MEWDSDILFIYYIDLNESTSNWGWLTYKFNYKKIHQKANGQQHSPEEIMALKPNNFFLSNWDYFYA